MSSNSDAAIPPNLSLDCVLANKTCMALTHLTVREALASWLTLSFAYRQPLVSVRFLHVSQIHRIVP